ncbi:hypothetical protein LCGC14_0999390 [marine sediment metagenome]|uniref:Uncharacterized protein n=1 Tax=marine sediment metagenome TaxID=412755 RepID=A0A0F9QLY2_9ZZZZ
MKIKNFSLCSLLFFILLTINSIIIENVYGYNVGIAQNQNLIWKCNVSNKFEMNALFGSTWDDSGIFKNLSKGKRMKWEINKVKINETFISVNISLWQWTFEKNWGIKDDNFQTIYFSNPGDYSQELNFSSTTSLVPFWFPAPVGEFLGELDLNNWYDVDNRVLPTLNVEIVKGDIGPNLPAKNIHIIAIYNDQGILDSYKLYTKGNVVIIDISLEHLPFYVLPTLITLILIFSLTVIFYIYKKRKK